MRKRVLMTTGALFAGLCARSFVPMQGQSIHHAGVLTQASSMGGPRAAHTATTLDDGRVLVVGGFTRSETAPDAEFYDATRGTFAPAPRMRTVRVALARAAPGR